MEKYVEARRDIFFTGKDGSLRSNRTLAQLAGQYAVDLFIGSTLQMDALGNSSTVTRGRVAGYGGAPNMGHNPGGRRHATDAWYNLKTSDDPLARGKKLVVQVAETFQEANKPVFVESLDAIHVKDQAKLRVAPVMIYGEDVTHIVTEEGIAYLYKSDSMAERREMIAAIAGVTPIGMEHNPKSTKKLREKGLIAMPEDLGIRRSDAKRSLLAAKNIDELVQWSGGLYNPPARFRSW
jgi:malonate decarboxylase alpha subunit